MDMFTRLKEKIGGMDDIIGRMLTLLSEWRDSTDAHSFSSYSSSYRIEASQYW